TQEQAADVARQFIGRIEPQLLAQVKLTEQNQNQPPRPLIEDALPSQWGLQFTRQVNGVPLPNDGIRVTVGANKKITEYNLTWTEQKFPATGQALSPAAAHQTYLKLAPMTLCYAPVSNAAGVRDLILVYKPLTVDRQS